MSSKKITSYEIDQIKNFENFIDKTIEQKPNILFIAGNLFGTSKPKNKTIEKVGKSFKKLSNSGIEVFLLSGSHDTPLPFSNDRPIHHIFEDIEKIHFLFSKKGISKEIAEPMFKGQIKDNLFQIFSVPTPFKSPDQFEFNLKIEKDYTNVFIISDIFSFKKNPETIFTNFLNLLNKNELNALLIGGIQDNSIIKREYKFQTIECPQIHKNNLNFCENASGIAIHNFNNKKFSKRLDLIPISKLNVLHNIIDLSQIAPENVNDFIYENIKKNSDQLNIFRLTLIGQIKKDLYHNIKIFKYSEIGRRINYYFELLDNIEFKESSQDIQRFDLLDELENFTRDKINKLNQEDEVSIYQEAINLIKKDWNI